MLNAYLCPMPKQQYIGYYRVSTKGQEISGLGLEAQISEVSRYLDVKLGIGDGKSRPDFEYTETETGKNTKFRPVLDAAIKKCKEVNGVLLIARLDRLSRSIHFVTGLQESGVDFICVDNPHATPLTIQIFAIVAQDEAAKVSIRTKAAIKAKCEREKEKGNLDFKWGKAECCELPMSDKERESRHKRFYHITTPEIVQIERLERFKIRREQDMEERRLTNKFFYTSLLIKGLMIQGKSLQQMVEAMNDYKAPTINGVVGRWTKIQITRIIDLAGYERVKRVKNISA